MNLDNRQAAELSAAARIQWAQFTKQQKAVVRFGMIPVEAAAELEKLGFKAREIIERRTDGRERILKPRARRVNHHQTATRVLEKFA